MATRRLDCFAVLSTGFKVGILSVVAGIKFFDFPM